MCEQSCKERAEAYERLDLINSENRSLT